MSNGPASKPGTRPFPPGLMSHAAGACCPVCGSGLSVWMLMQTGRLGRAHLSAARGLPSTPCPNCGTAVALGGSALWQRTALFSIVLPVTVAALVLSITAAVLLGQQDSALLMVSIVALEVLLLPAVLSIRLLGVERRDIDGPAGDA